MFDFEIGVVIPAAGKSERFNGDRPKQYSMIMGKPLVLFTIEAFLNLPFKVKICVVIDDVNNLKKLLKSYEIDCSQILIVPGGGSRHKSIFNGLTAFNSSEVPVVQPKVVIVHDGARPLVPTQSLIQLINGALIYGAVGLIRPLTSTVLEPGADNVLNSCLDRHKLVASETPQAFLFSLIHDAYKKCSTDELVYSTDCLQILKRKSEVTIKLIPGGEHLWKVTEKKDLHLAKGRLKELLTKICIIVESGNDGLYKLAATLCQRVTNATYLPSSTIVSREEKYNTAIFLQQAHTDQKSINLEPPTFLDPHLEGVIIHVFVDLEQSVSCKYKIEASTVCDYENIKKVFRMVLKDMENKKQSILAAKNAFNCLYNISQMLNTGLSKEELIICVRLCEKGVNPTMLAHIVTEMKKEAKNISERAKKSGERGY